MDWLLRTVGSWMNLVPGSPTCRLFWRWELACWLAATGRRINSPFATDEWVVRALRHRAGKEDGVHDAAVADAARLFDAGPAWRRDLLEAYILTGEPFSTVAERSTVPEPTAEAYASVYFDVRRRLDTPGWVAPQVF